MKHKFIALASSLLVIGAIGAGVGALTGDLWRTPVSLGSINGQITLDAHIKNIDVEIPTGNVTVTGTKGNTLTYSGELTALHQRAQNEANQLVRSEWKIEKNGDTLKLVLEQPMSERIGFSTSWRSPHLELNIPSTMTCEISTYDGSVNMRLMDANIKVQTSNDRITASNINASANLQTSDGTITLANIGGSATAVDSNSAIIASSAINNIWNLRTSNARISLSVPRCTNARINASTSDSSVGGNIPWESNSSGQGTATLGTGSNVIHLQTSSGSISVNYLH